MHAGRTGAGRGSECAIRPRAGWRRRGSSWIGRPPRSELRKGRQSTGACKSPRRSNVNSEAFQGERNPRAQAQGENAVDRANAPSPTAEVDRTRGQAWGENAVDKALNPPTGSGGGFWTPGEAADTASAVGEKAVAGALAKKARGKMARGRLKDPVDADDRQPE